MSNFSLLDDECHRNIAYPEQQNMINRILFLLSNQVIRSIWSFESIFFFMFEKQYKYCHITIMSKQINCKMNVPDISTSNHTLLLFIHRN